MNHRIQGHALRKLHIAVAAVLCLLQAVPDQALGNLQGFLRIIGLVNPAHKHLGMLRLAGDGKGALGVNLGVHGSPDSLSVCVDQGRHGHIIVLIARRRGIPAPAHEHAHDLSRILYLGIVHVKVMGKYFLVNQAVRIQGMEPGDGLLVGLRGRRKDHLAVIGHKVIDVVQLSEGSEEGLDSLLAVVEVIAAHAEGKGNLVRGIPVPVGILLPEGLQHRFKLFFCLRHLKSQLIQPRLVDKHLVVGDRLQVIDGGKGVNVPVRGRNQLFVSWIRVQHSLQVWRILVDQII